MRLPESLNGYPRSVHGAHVLIAQAKRSGGACGSGSVETRLRRLEAEQSIRTVLNVYAYCYDNDDLDGLMQIYSPDCVLVNDKGTYIGSAAIRANYARNMAGRSLGQHHLADVEIALDDEGVTAWASAFIHNLGVKDDVPVGTMANCLFHLSLVGADEEVDFARWVVTECRIVVMARHSSTRIALDKPAASPEASSAVTVGDLLDGVWRS